MELIADSDITKDWLIWYGEAWRVYEDYKKQKQLLEKKIGVLKGIDYSKDKVINGSPYGQSEEERYTMRLEKINNHIKECEEILFPARERLKQQIKRIPRPEYRKILILRYIERWKWTDIIEECFWYEDDFNKEDFQKYKDRVMQWNRQAVNKLEQLNCKPFISANENLQLHL